MGSKLGPLILSNSHFSETILEGNTTLAPVRAWVRFYGRSDVAKTCAPHSQSFINPGRTPFLTTCTMGARSLDPPRESESKGPY